MVARQLRNKTLTRFVPRVNFRTRLEPCQRLRRKAQLGPPTNREAETQKASPRRTSHRALGRVHPQSQTPGKEACHACHHPLTRPPRPHVDVAVVGVAHEAMAATLQLLVHNVQHQVRQQRRQRAALRRPFDSRTHQAARQSARAQEAANRPEQTPAWPPDPSRRRGTPGQRTSPSPGQPRCQSPRGYGPAHASPPDGPSVRDETRSSNPKSRGPTPSVTPASPLAG